MSTQSLSFYLHVKNIHWRKPWRKYSEFGGLVVNLRDCDYVDIEMTKFYSDFLLTNIRHMNRKTSIGYIFHVLILNTNKV